MTMIDGVIKRAALPRVAGLGRRGMRVAVAVGAAGAAFSHIARAVGSRATAPALVKRPEARHALCVLSPCRSSPKPEKRMALRPFSQIELSCSSKKCFRKSVKYFSDFCINCRKEI